MTTVGYWIYSTFPNLPLVKSQDPVGVFFTGSFRDLYWGNLVCNNYHEGANWKQKENYLNILGGLSWGIAAFAYIFAARELGATRPSSLPN